MRKIKTEDPGVKFWLSKNSKGLCLKATRLNRMSNSSVSLTFRDEQALDFLDSVAKFCKYRWNDFKPHAPQNHFQWYGKLYPYAMQRGSVHIKYCAPRLIQIVLTAPYSRWNYRVRMDKNRMETLMYEIYKFEDGPTEVE